MKCFSLALIGFGNVGQALANLLLRKRPELESNFGFTFQVVGIATYRHGIAIDLSGIDLEQALKLRKTGQSLCSLNKFSEVNSIQEFIGSVSADVLFENSPVNHESGQPAIDYLRLALERGMHAITANKGPVVFGYPLLSTLAAKMGRRFLFESAVMDGAPIFSLFRGSLPAATLLGFKGILNSCTNLILERMEAGESLEQAISYAQSIGIAETNPSADVDGWDAAIKVAALCTVLMGIPMTPQQVERTGISAISPQMLAEARQTGCKWKLVCTCRRLDNKVEAQVSPTLVTPDSPLFSIHGTSSFVQFELDSLPGLGILESNPGPETTAYGLLVDMINAFRGM